jgi:hypothetical protein
MSPSLRIVLINSIYHSLCPDYVKKITQLARNSCEADFRLKPGQCLRLELLKKDCLTGNIGEHIVAN